jgi:hypothetical protein
MTLLLPRPGKTITLPGGAVVADPKLYDVDSTSVLASSAWAVVADHSYKATFIVPLDHYDYAGVGKGEPNSAKLSRITT